MCVYFICSNIYNSEIIHPACLVIYIISTDEYNPEFIHPACLQES